MDYGSVWNCRDIGILLAHESMSKKFQRLRGGVGLPVVWLWLILHLLQVLYECHIMWNLLSCGI